MGTATNVETFSENQSELFDISAVRVSRVNFREIILSFTVADNNKAENLLAQLEFLYVTAKKDAAHGHIVSLSLERNAVDTIAEVLTNLKQAKLLSEDLFTRVCANFPADLEGLVDDRLAKLVGVVPNHPFDYLQADRSAGKTSLAKAMIALRERWGYADNAESAVVYPADKFEHVESRGDLLSDPALKRPEMFDYFVPKYQSGVGALFEEQGLGKKAVRESLSAICSEHPAVQLAEMRKYADIMASKGMTPIIIDQEMIAEIARSLDSQEADGAEQAANSPARSLNK